MSSNVEIFRELHTGPTPLLLPNAWDAGSARVFESLGATAIATTSAGVAWALGYRDGRLLPIEEVVSVVARMVRVLTVPLTVDIENGYSDNPNVAAENVMRLVDLGVAGINIEDGPDDALLLATKVDAIREAVSKANADLFVNVRSDVILAGLVPAANQIAESIIRGKLYTRAGADGLFLPGIHQSEEIEAVVNEVSLPLNVMALPGLASATELGALGVRRLSAGSGITQALWAKAQVLAQDFLHNGRIGALYDGSMSYSQLQGLFIR
jgi:2-methylisocitrate lyase-like PEP mutase family enzyme